MNENKQKYDNESITSLKGADRVRLRPAVIFGSDGIEGCQHAFFEILSNAIDEARQGFGSLIEVTKHIDKSITVKDYGRGMPVDYNVNEERYNWELLFCELYAGGKYNNNDGDNYEYSLGLNGLGLCSTQYSSLYMDAIIIRDGFKYKLHFEKGENISFDKEECFDKKTSSTVTWKSDLDVFTDINIPLDYFLETIKRQAVVNEGLRFKFTDEEGGQIYDIVYENGIVDYIKELCGDEDNTITEVHGFSHQCEGQDREDKPVYKLKFQIAFAFSNEINAIEYYHNSSFLSHGGAPDKAMKAGFIYAIDNYLKTNSMYKKDEKKITFTDIEDSIIYISNSFSTITSYENQTKKSITNKFIQDAMTEFLKTNLQIYFVENKVEADKIANQILVNKRSRESAEKTRIKIKKQLTSSIDINNRVNKFVNCRSKDKNEREIYIVEGDSALGACKLGRDPNIQAIIPVRGKILNCLKADYDKIFNSDIIVDLLRVLGCGVEINSKHNKDINMFNYDNFNWDKIVICTDADVDGFQIRTLILTMLYRLVPTLIAKKKVFIAESPLYEITSGKKTFFAYSENEKSKITKDLKNYKIQRSKGLGENEPEMMWLTTMNPKTRKLILVEEADIEETIKMFETLLGDDITSRKEFIKDFGHKYIDVSDIG